MRLEKIRYEDLNARAKEMYNFQKAAARLADYGFTCLWLTNDWQGADFIAVHIDGVTDIKVQLKGRLSFAQKYRGKDIHICFLNGNDAFLYPHDEILDKVEHLISDRTWQAKGTWSTPAPTRQFRELLQPYRF
ncbi:hypothetical protein [Denitromonas sp.]|uniref:hypothetical protein n=1 Tax=Denitromonas sp. TaxID=2734609 RepID=UPI002FDE68E1